MSIKQLLRNIHYLSRIDLRQQEIEVLFRAAKETESYLKYEYPESIDNIWTPNVIDYEATLELLKRDPKSLVRLGDGEVELINGADILFQKYNSELADCLRQLVEGYRPDIYAGINYNYFHSTINMPKYVRRFYMTVAAKYREWLLVHCSRERPFWIAAGFNQLYMVYQDYDFGGYYRRLMSLFEGRDVTIFIGKNTRAKLSYNVFSSAASCEWVDCPSSHAFDSMDSILEESRKRSRSRLLVYCIGPASKYAVVKMTDEGHMAWDMGHLPADYDAYCRKVVRTDEAIADFNAPDEG